MNRAICNISKRVLMTESNPLPTGNDIEKGI